MLSEPVNDSAIARAPEAIFMALQSNSVSADKLDLVLQNAGAPFNILSFETKTEGAQVLQWQPRSILDNTLLRAPTQLPSRSPTLCKYEMRIRDRSGVERVFEIHIDVRSNPAAYDFIEVK